jgi:serine/threonine-protein phosphatase 5
LTLLDASEAIKADPTFAKAYYRRACAYIALSHFDDAIKDLKRAVKMCPTDKEARTKLEMAKQ